MPLFLPVQTSAISKDIKIYDSTYEKTKNQIFCMVKYLDGSLMFKISKDINGITIVHTLLYTFKQI